MTAGVREYGSIVGSFYYRRAWSGVNGRTGLANSYLITIEKRSLSTVQGYNPGCYYTGPDWDGNKSIALTSRITDMVRGHSFNLGVATAEGGKTVSMVKRTATILTRAALYLRKGNFQKAARTLGITSTKNGKLIDPVKLTSKDISNMWLELQYGWKPLLSDVYESAKALEKFSSAPRTSFVSATQRWSSQESPWYPNVVGYARSGEFTAKVGLYMVETLSEPRSLGLHDPLTIAWELVPFSFVADWFIPIGPYLNGLAAIPNLQTNGYLNKRRSLVCDSLQPKTPGLWDGYYTSRAHGEFVQFTREGWNASVPPPQFKPLPEAMSPGHIYNAVALLRSVFF